MNAPLAATALATALDVTLEHIPLDNIRVSPLPVQTLRRARFDPAALLELAASIKALGVAQPIVVRPVPVQGHVRFEIVAGERRWIAADRAGLDHVPAIVRELTDEQALELQLVENLQREGLHPLEEGAGYKQLMDLKHADAETIGALVGKSRSYVYSRTKLLDLCPAGREALQAGTLDASQALLIARLGGDKLQRKALERLNHSALSYQAALRILRNDFMVPLDTAPFDHDDATLETKQHEPLPACSTCPSRSGNDAELNVALNDPHICTDKPCFDIKARIFWQRQRQTLEASGAKILSGDQAAKLAPGRYDGAVKNGYLNLNVEAEELDWPDDEEPTQAKGETTEAFEERLNAWEVHVSPTRPTYRALLGDNPPGTVLVEGKGAALHALLPLADAVKLLKAKGHTPPKYWSSSPQKPLFDDPAATAKATAERAREEEQMKVEEEYRARLFKAIWQKWKGPLKRPDLERIAGIIKEYDGNDDVLDDVVPDGWNFVKATEPELLRYIACVLLVGDLDVYHHTKPAQLLEVAQRLNIDAKKIRAQVIADLKPTSVAPEDKPKPAAKK